MKVKLEVNIFDFDQDIYGKPLKLIFLKRLRDEIKFANLNALKHQLEKDKEMCYRLMKDFV
jgi:riboflavin kinase/FMN adenylyltransferase